jgi:hypothetical protein
VTRIFMCRMREAMIEEFRGGSPDGTSPPGTRSDWLTR